MLSKFGEGIDYEHDHNNFHRESVRDELITWYQQLKQRIDEYS